MITVHHLENSRSQRILWLLEELGLPYEVIRYERDPETLFAPPALRTIHPLGKSPIITDHRDTRARTIAETGAIIDYLVSSAGGALGPPGGLDAALNYRYFLHYAEGSLMPPLLIKLVLGRIPLVGGMAQKRMQPLIDIHLDFVERELTSRSWFAGNAFSAADIMMSFPLEAARERAGLNQSRPATVAWLERIHGRPAYQAALARGGAYKYA